MVFDETEKFAYQIWTRNSWYQLWKQYLTLSKYKFSKVQVVKKVSNSILTAVNHIWVRYTYSYAVQIQLKQSLPRWRWKLTFSNWSMIRASLWGRCCQMRFSEGWIKIQSFREVLRYHCHQDRVRPDPPTHQIYLNLKLKNVTNTNTRVSIKLKM